MNIEQVAALYEADGFPEVADIIRRTPSDELLRRLRHYWMPPNNDDADNLVEKSGRKLTVPAGAITKDAKGAYVFREDDVGEYSVRRVKVGDEVEDGIAIAPGVRLVASDDDDDDDDYDNYDNYDDDAPAPRRYVQDIGGEGRPLRSGQTVIDWDVSWTNPEQIRRWWRHYALLEEALRPPTLEEAAAGLIVALGGDRRERRAAVEALDAALAALPAAARAEATARYGLAADDRAALLADVADLEAVVEHVWGQPEEDPRGRAPDGIQARVPVALFVGTLDAEATINALEARGFGRLARQFRLLVAIGRGERFEDPDLVSLQRALEARGVLVRSYPGFSVPERRAEWVITPGLSLFARGRYYGSGPLEALTWYGRTLHLLGYPEPEPALSAVFGVGRTRWMPAAERARLVEGLKRRKADVDAEVAQQWADTDGEVGLPPVSAKVRALIEVMSEAGLAGRLLERHGVARTQWEAHARPPAQRPTGAALRRLAADLPPELGDGIALASELIAAADVADAHANEVIEAQPTAAEILGDLDKFETTPTQIAASFRERDATAHLASRIEELVEEGTVGASAALLVDIRGSWVERQRKVGYRVRSLSITAQRWTSQRAVDVRALEGQAPSGLFGGEAVTVLRLNDKGPVEHQGVELRSVRPLEHVHATAPASTAAGAHPQPEAGPIEAR
jgi:hypothetical protein